MRQVKYLRQKTTKYKGVVWAVSPPKYVQEAIGASYDSTVIRMMQ